MPRKSFSTFSQKIARENIKKLRAWQSFFTKWKIYETKRPFLLKYLIHEILADFLLQYCSRKLSRKHLCPRKCRENMCLRRKLTPVANNGNRHLKWTWRQKFIFLLNSTTQKCANKFIKIFLLEDFFYLPPVSTTPVVHLEPRISPPIFEKFRNGRNGIFRCLWETDEISSNFAVSRKWIMTFSFQH